MSFELDRLGQCAETAVRDIRSGKAKLKLTIVLQYQIREPDGDSKCLWHHGYLSSRRTFAAECWLGDLLAVERAKPASPR